MKLRESSLPPGWYPGNAGEINRFLSGYLVNDSSRVNNSSQPNTALAAIAPHAGWHYSGKIAAKAAASLDRNSDTIVVIGGHLPEGYPPLFAMEDAVHTPLGNMPINTKLRGALYETLGGREDRFRDNTVEVLLPMVRFFLPNASLLWLRLPAEISSFEAGKAIAIAAGEIDCAVGVLASTDLTHYGPNYGFTPRGIGPQALRWVEEINDRNFIKAVEAGDPQDVLERAETDSSSCSVGAVLGVMGFASAANFGNARLLEYGTSADAANGHDAEIPGVQRTPDSFVGYAAFTF